MKITKAEIVGFGHYRQQMFEFLPGNQLFFGQNEVGKSTLYQFIQAILFGFPKKSLRKRDYTPQDGAAYGGKLWLEIEPYGEIMVERYRQVNRGQAKVWLGSEEGDEQLLLRLLAPLSQDVFQEVFTFQQEQLSQIERMQEKELHAALISLGISGSKQLMEKIQDYHKTNQQLFKPRGQRLPLNKRLNEWQRLRETIQQKEAQENDMKQAYQQVSAYTEQQKELRQQLQQLQQYEQTLNQQKMNWPLYEEWQQLQRLKESSMSEKEHQQLRLFYQEYQQLSDEMAKKQAELSRLEHGQESSHYFFYLDKESKIQELLRQKVPIIRMVDEYERLNDEYEKIHQAFAQLVERWGWKQEIAPPELDEQIFSLLHRLEELDEALAQHELRVQWLTEKSQPVEEEITKIENKYPELLAKTTTQPYLLPAIGGGLFLVSFLLPTPLNYVGMLLGGAALVFGGGLYVYKKVNPASQIKPLWQEKLLQLDAYAAEIEAEKAALTQTQQEKNQLLTYLQPSFGNNTNYHTWHQVLEEYEQAVTNFHEYTTLLTESRQQQEHLIHELGEVEAEFQAFVEWLPLENKEIQDKLTVLEEFADKMQDIKLTRLQQPSTLIAQQLKRTKEERDALFAKYQHLLEKFGLEHPTEIPLWMKQWEQQQKQTERKDELTQLLTPLFPKKIRFDELTTQLQAMQEKQENLQQKLSKLLEEKQRVQLQIEHLQIDGVLDELYQEESRLLSEIEDLAVTWSTNQVLSASLSDLATELSEQQLPQLLHQASHYFNLLTNGRYNQVLLSDGILHVATEQSFLDIYTLSTGTKDQLIMAVRFAYLSLQGQAMVSPVIIDDGWLHYDSSRKEQLAKLFAEFGEKHQVICLSSDREMVSYYQRLQQPVIEIKQRM